MSNPFFGQRIIHLESVDSTNNYAAKVFRSGQVPPGTVIMADIQNNGRGQREKTWQSDAFQNLTFSLCADIKLWKINTLIDLNRLVAISLYRFFERFHLCPKIKWPNDIMINDQKISGILIENYFQEGVSKTIVGIGINVNQTSFNVPRATSLLNETGKQFIPRELLNGFIFSANHVFSELLTRKSNMIHKEYDQLLWKLNQHTSFNHNEKGVFEGKITGTSADGELIINTQEGDESFRNGTIQY